MTLPLIHKRTGRNPRAITALALVWLGLAALYVGVGAHPLILAFLALFTLPLALEIATNPLSEFHLTSAQMGWKNRQQEISVTHDQIEGVTLITSLDLSIRVLVTLKDGRKLRVPPDCTPQIAAFRAAAEACGLNVTRRHFTLLS